MTRAVMWLLLAVVAMAAAVLSFAALRDLAVLCGFSTSLAWLLPVVIDAGAAAGCLVWLRGDAQDRGRRFARALTVVLLASSVAGNAVVHGLTAYQLAAPWWLVVAVSAVAPAVLGAVVHLGVLTAQGSSAPAQIDVESLDEPPEGDGTPDRPVAMLPMGDDVGSTDVVSSGVQAAEDQAAEALLMDNTVSHPDDDLVAQVQRYLDNHGPTGRGVLARELNISQHQARRALAATNGHGGTR